MRHDDNPGCIGLRPRELHHHVAEVALAVWCGSGESVERSVNSRAAHAVQQPSCGETGTDRAAVAWSVLPYQPLGLAVREFRVGRREGYGGCQESGRKHGGSVQLDADHGQHAVEIVVVEEIDLKDALGVLAVGVGHAALDPHRTAQMPAQLV